MPTVLPDPVLVVKETLREQWKLTGQLGRGKIHFNTGVRAPSRRFPSLEIQPVTDGPLELYTLHWYMQYPYAVIHVWVRPHTWNESSLGTAKKHRYEMLEEAKRIMHREQTNLKTQTLQPGGLTWEEVGNVMYLDEYQAIEPLSNEIATDPDDKGVFPILHSIIHIRMKRWHHNINASVN